MYPSLATGIYETAVALRGRSASIVPTASPAPPHVRRPLAPSLAAHSTPLVSREGTLPYAVPNARRTAKGRFRATTMPNTVFFDRPDARLYRVRNANLEQFCRVSPHAMLSARTQCYGPITLLR